MPYVQTPNDAIHLLWEAFRSYLNWKAIMKKKEDVKHDVKKTLKKSVMRFASPNIQKEEGEFIHEHYGSIERSARRHKIPHELLAGILYTELTFSFLPLAMDDFISMAKLPVDDASSVGPGQMGTEHLERWGHEGSKYELAWKLHTDMEFAIDASARLIHEDIVKYRGE